jgi:hypothetical protein
MLLLAACDSGGYFRVVNQTSFPVYVTLGDEAEQTIPANSEHTFEVATETEHFFNPDVEQEVPVRLLGETYQIYDEENECFTDTTTIVVKVGETTNAYINPNRASFKVVNDSSQPITSITLYKHNFVNVVASMPLGSLNPGESTFRRIDYATPSNNFYYFATLEMGDGSSLTYGNQDTVLLVDEQFLVTVTDPD